MAEPDRVNALITELVADLEILRGLRGVARTRLADALADAAPRILRSVGDQGVWEATRPGGQPRGAPARVAQELGTTESTVAKRASWHVRGTRP